LDRGDKAYQFIEEKYPAWEVGYFSARLVTLIELFDDCVTFANPVF